MISALIGWYIWVISTYFIATKFLREKSAETERGDRKAAIRAMGFACAPGVIRLLGMIPGLGMVVLAVSSIWMIVAATIAVKVALNIENTASAAAVCIIGCIIGAIAQGLLLVVLFSVFGIS
jgi:hypothetical protein